MSCACLNTSMSDSCLTCPYHCQNQHQSPLLTILPSIKALDGCGVGENAWLQLHARLLGCIEPIELCITHTALAMEQIEHFALGNQQFKHVLI